MRIANLGDAFKRWVRVYHDCIRRVSVRREKLFLVWRPLQGRDLGRRSEGVKTCARSRVPDVYGCIIGTTASGEERALPGAPRKGL